MVRNSVAVAIWTAVSRLSGLGRVGAIAAVLGPTYLGNTFQAMNTLPNLMYELLAGSLFAALLVPALVGHIDRGNARATERVAGGFLGLALVGFAALTVVAILVGPFLVRLFTLSVPDPELSAAQRRVALPLLALLMPQVMLYAVAYIGGAVLNARGRFALAAAAPALENLGVIATLCAVAVLFGTGRELGEVQVAEILLLGAGTTTAVGLHATVQFWGSWRAGVRLIPRAGWREPEVRQVLRRTIPSLGYVWLKVTTDFAILLVANRVPGGVIAFQLAFNFFSLPVALGAEPILIALRPQLTRLLLGGKLQLFKDELVRGAALVLFLTVPASVAFLALGSPLAQAIAVGAMESGAGVTLISASIAALAVGVVGHSAFILATDASYVRGDTRSPFTAMLARTLVSLSIMGFAFVFLRGTPVLVALGIAVSAGAITGAAQLARRLYRSLPPDGEPLFPALARSLAASLVMIGPAYFVATHPPHWIAPQASQALAFVAAATLGATTFLLVQRSCRSPELTSLLGGLKASLPMTSVTRLGT